jgi:hypothetical protein
MLTRENVNVFYGVRATSLYQYHGLYQYPNPTPTLR